MYRKSSRGMVRSGGNTTTINAKLVDCKPIRANSAPDTGVATYKQPVDRVCVVRYEPYGKRVDNKIMGTRGDVLYANKDDPDQDNELAPYSCRLEGLEVDVSWNEDDVVTYARLPPGQARDDFVIRRILRTIMERTTTPGTIPSEVTREHVDENIAGEIAGKVDTRFTSLRGIPRNQPVVAVPPDPRTVGDGTMGPYGGHGGSMAVTMLVTSVREAYEMVMEPFTGKDKANSRRILRILGQLAHRIVTATEDAPIQSYDLLDLVEQFNAEITPSCVTEHRIGHTGESVCCGEGVEGKVVLAAEFG